MTERINEDIEVFLRAIENGTLAKSFCCACAVGNLVTHGLKGTIIRKDVGDIVYFTNDVDSDAWGLVFATTDGEQIVVDSYMNKPSVVRNVKATKFSIQELMKIEYAFETNTKIRPSSYHSHSVEQIRKDQIKGLEAVVQVMLDFDDVKETVQEVFSSKVELIPI